MPCRIIPYASGPFTRVEFPLHRFDDEVFYFRCLFCVVRRCFGHTPTLLYREANWKPKPDSFFANVWTPVRKVQTAATWGELRIHDVFCIRVRLWSWRKHSAHNIRCRYNIRPFNAVPRDIITSPIPIVRHGQEPIVVALAWFVADQPTTVNISSVTDTRILCNRARVLVISNLSSIGWLLSEACWGISPTQLDGQSCLGSCLKLRSRRARVRNMLVNVRATVCIMFAFRTFSRRRKRFMSIRSRPD